MKKQEQAAIEAVAKHFGGTWERSEDPSQTFVSIAGRRIAVAVTTVKQRIAHRADLAKPRLRFDRVVRELIARLQAALRTSVPDGTTVIFTMTAPIRLPSKTAEALEDKIRVCLARRSSRVHCEEAIHGNQIQIRLVKSSSRRISKVVGLVHNPDSDPDMLIHITQSLLQHIAAAAAGHTRGRSAKERWLVTIIEDAVARVETYRQVYAQLSIPTDFTKILMVFAGGRLETLTGAGDASWLRSEGALAVRRATGSPWVG